MTLQYPNRGNVGPEPALPMPYNAVKTAIRQWAYVQANNRWQNIETCRQAKLIIQGHSSGRTRELLRLPRQKLTLATGILTGHSQLNRHLSVMGIISDPTVKRDWKQQPTSYVNVVTL